MKYKTKIEFDSAKDLLDFLRSYMSESSGGQYQSTIERIREHAQRSGKIFISPAGRIAGRAIEYLKSIGINVDGLIDRSKERWGCNHFGVPIMGIDEAVAIDKSGLYLVASAMYDSVITEELVKSGVSDIISFPQLARDIPAVFSTREYGKMADEILTLSSCEQILSSLHLLADDVSKQVLISKLLFFVSLDKKYLDQIKSSDPIYFDNTVYTFKTSPVIVDVGAYRGDTLRQCLNIDQFEIKKYFAVEPDPLVHKDLLLESLSLGDKFKHLNVGLSNENGYASFAITGKADSRLVSQDKTQGIDVKEDLLEIKLARLDDIIGDESPDFVKFDIEGAERPALEGAKNTIAKSMPILAVSAYHFPCDIWELPLYISSFSDGYRYFLRHYTREVDDTVLYAVPK